jgi:hypothetical protein
VNWRLVRFPFTVIGDDRLGGRERAARLARVADQAVAVESVPAISR